MIVRPAAQVVVEIWTELVVNEVKSKRVDGRVDESETEACRFEHVPVRVEGDVSVVPAEQVDMPW